MGSKRKVHDACGREWVVHAIARTPGGLRWVCPGLPQRPAAGREQRQEQRR